MPEGPPNKRVKGVKRAWTWPNRNDLLRDRERANERKRLLKERRRRDKNAGRK